MTDLEQFAAAFPDADRVVVEGFDYGTKRGVMLFFGKLRCATKFTDDIEAAIERLRVKIEAGPVS